MIQFSLDALYWAKFAREDPFQLVMRGLDPRIHVFFF
jgi:hypothetical protein